MLELVVGSGFTLIGVIVGAAIARMPSPSKPDTKVQNSAYDTDRGI